MGLDGQQPILVVEDSDDDFFATERAFKKAGLANPIRRCTNGDQAVDYLFRLGEFADPETSPRPGVVLLDLNLPGLDGRDVLRKIKADPHLHKIPVIVLTTSSAEQDIERCYADGANTYVQKPVDLQGFFLAISRLKDYWLEVAILPRGEG
ncbi:MAG: response regulator [Magnetospirillum sp.]|nr:response regulator [Magnetospirillum sp.]